MASEKAAKGKTPEKLSDEEKRALRKIEEAAIIKDALGGDQKAYETLMDRYKPKIFSLMYRMIHSEAEANDLVQEAFMKAFNSLASFNNEFAFSTWLYKIATNNCIDYIRKKRLNTFSIDKPLTYKDSQYKQELPDVTYHPEESLLRKERTDFIKKAIEALPEKYKVSILLRHNEDKSYEEIATILNIPIGTVKARIFRAREMLNRFLRSRIMDTE